MEKRATIRTYLSSLLSRLRLRLRLRHRRLRLRHGLRARSLENVPLAKDHSGPDLHTLSNPH